MPKGVGYGGSKKGKSMKSGMRKGSGKKTPMKKKGMRSNRARGR